MPQSRLSAKSLVPAAPGAALQRKAEAVLANLASAGTSRPTVTSLSRMAKRDLIERLRPAIARCRKNRVPYRDIVEALRYEAGVDVCERTLVRVLDAPAVGKR